VHHSTTTVLGGANRTLTGATGSLLLERLASGTGHFTAVLHLVGSLAGSGKLCDDNLVHQGNVGDHIEHLCGQINRTGLLSSLVENVNGGSHG
jgi:hypothetical protein